MTLDNRKQKGGGQGTESELTQHLQEQQLGCDIIILPDGFGRPNSEQSSHEHLGSYCRPLPPSPCLLHQSFLVTGRSLEHPQGPQDSSELKAYL